LSVARPSSKRARTSSADEPRGDLEILLHQFTSPLIYILLVAFVVTILIDEYTDAAVIAAVLVINAVIGFIQERKADRSVHALMQMAAPTSTVVRDGKESGGRRVDLVPGDIVLLTSGTRVPADLRLVRTTSLQVDESLLTGESKPARKSTDPSTRTRWPATAAAWRSWAARSPAAGAAGWSWRPPCRPSSARSPSRSVVRRSPRPRCSSG
jgi:magnesium-transporting ATPase (P-type)